MTNLETAVDMFKIAVPGEPVEMLGLGDRVATSKTYFLPKYASEIPSIAVTCKCGKEYSVGDKVVTCLHADEKQQIVFERPVRKNKYELRLAREFERPTKVNHDREHPTQKAKLTHYR